jgi:chromosome segregation ATPase
MSFIDMASSNQCSVCKKAAGTCICVGCKAYFCGADFKDHRGGLLNEFDGLSEDSYNLQDKINKTNEENELDSPLFSRIDEWQQTTIEKVKQAAEEARKEVIKLMNSKRVELTNQFETLSEELKELRNTEGFVEQDLTRLKQTIHQLNEQLNDLIQSSTIELHMMQSDQIAWNQLLNVKNKKSAITGDQRNQQPLGEHAEQFKIAILPSSSIH